MNRGQSICGLHTTASARTSYTHEMTSSAGRSGDNAGRGSSDQGRGRGGRGRGRGKGKDRDTNVRGGTEGSNINVGGPSLGKSPSNNGGRTGGRRRGGGRGRGSSARESVANNDVDAPSQAPSQDAKDKGTPGDVAAVEEKVRAMKDEVSSNHFVLHLVLAIYNTLIIYLVSTTTLTSHGLFSPCVH